MAELTAILRHQLTKTPTGWTVNLCLTEDVDGVPLSVVNRSSRKDKKIEVTVVGVGLPDYKDLYIKYSGEWVESKYGVQFKATAYENVSPTEESAIVAFLLRTSVGIGHGFAQRIVDKYGKDTIKILEETPEKFLSIKGIGRSRLKGLVDAYHTSLDLGKVSVFLSNFGIGADLSAKIYSFFGKDTIQTVSREPFRLLEVEGIGFETADRAARKLMVMLNSDVRICACAKNVLMQARYCGHLFVTADLLASRLFEALNKGFEVTVVAKEEIIAAIKKAALNKTLICRAGRNIFLPDADEAEQGAALRLYDICRGRRMSYARKEDYDKFIESWTQTNGENKLSDEQKNAALTSLTSKVSVITGGAGTGKTSALKAIIAAYKNFASVDDTVTLIAPTGKAARRMTAQTGCPASTIHSALRLFGDDVVAAGDTDLPQGLIVCDETSMLDAFVAKVLFDSVSVNSQLVLLGDKDQLPAVGAGNVLKELIRSGEIPVSRLTKIYRQGADAGNIIENGKKINEGNANLTYGDNFSFIPAADEAEAKAAVLREYGEAVRNVGFSDVAILCPMRQYGEVCSNAVNLALQNEVNPRVAGEMTYHTYVNGVDTEFRLRDRVVQTKNNSITANGDVGTVEEIVSKPDENGKLQTYVKIAFASGVVAEYGKDDMEHISLAYALTIHKSQGDEYNTVIIPLLMRQKKMLKRNLLYTAITRAKKNVVIVGEKSAIDMCVKTADVDKRNTMFADRLHFLFHRFN